MRSAAAALSIEERKCGAGCEGARVWRFLKFEPSRLFVCQRTCHPLRYLVAKKSCRVMWRYFGNRTINDGYSGPFYSWRVIRVVPFLGVSDVHLEPSFWLYKMDQWWNGSLLFASHLLYSSFLLLSSSLVLLYFCCVFHSKSLPFPTSSEKIFLFMLFYFFFFLSFFERKWPLDNK